MLLLYPLCRIPSPSTSNPSSRQRLATGCKIHPFFHSCASPFYQDFFPHPPSVPAFLPPYPKPPRPFSSRPGGAVWRLVKRSLVHLPRNGHPLVFARRFVWTCPPPPRLFQTSEKRIPLFPTPLFASRKIFSLFINRGLPCFGPLLFCLQLVPGFSHLFSKSPAVSRVPILSSLPALSFFSVRRAVRFTEHVDPGSSSFSDTPF